MKARPKILSKIILISILTVIAISGLYVLEQQANQQIEWKVHCGQNVSNFQGVFIFSTTCPYSQMMVPLVENSRMNWYWIDVDNTNCTIIDIKFGFEGLIPHFYCIKTGEFHRGTLSRRNFTNFVENCLD